MASYFTDLIVKLLSSNHLVCLNIERRASFVVSVAEINRIRVAPNLPVTVTFEISDRTKKNY